MHVKSAALSMMAMMGLLGTLAAPGMAAPEETKDTALPRSFQHARLGMTLSELVSVVPDAKKVSLNRHDPADRTVMIPSKERSIQRVEYRFYNDRLRELAIYYTYAEVPGGFTGLRQRLQETYGEPVVAEHTEYDPGPNIASVKKTIWNDEATLSVLAQSHKLYQGQERYDLVLTITDRELQQMFEKDQEERRRQEALRIPIPLPGPGAHNKQTALSRIGNPSM